MLVGRTAVRRLVGHRGFARCEEANGPDQRIRDRAAGRRRPTSGYGRRLRSGGASGSGATGPGAGIDAASRVGPARNPACAVCCIAPAARAPNTSPSSSELLARRLAPCTPVQATSPAAYSPGTVGAAPQVGLDAAHDVVRRGSDGNQVAREVQPDRTAGGRRRREPRMHRLGIEVPQREINRLSRPAALVDDGAGDAVAWRQVAGRVVARGERLAGRVDQPRPLAAQRLRQQRAGGARARRARSDETARTPCPPPARRRSTRGTRHRRWQSPDWWCR